MENRNHIGKGKDHKILKWAKHKDSERKTKVLEKKHPLNHDLYDDKFIDFNDLRQEAVQMHANYNLDNQRARCLLLNVGRRMPN